MRKYLTNVSVISSVTSAWPVIRATRTGPRDWRLALLWASWGIGVAVALIILLFISRRTKHRG